jgi:sigma-B regulation protein RsbU (phosphoserine phosphatase)
MTELFIRPKKGDPFSFALGDEKVCLGRASNNDIVLSDLYSSGCHALIVPTEKGYAIQDLGSKNGTFLNERRVSGQVDLVRGDTIRIGETQIVFDREYQTSVVIVPGTTFTHGSNTIIQVKDILKKPPKTVLVAGPVGPSDTDKVPEGEEKFAGILSAVSQALIYHMTLDKLLDHIMDLIIQHIPMDRAVLMLKDATGQLVQKVVRVQSSSLRTQNILVSRSIVQTALEKNSAILVSDIQSDEQLRGQISVIQAQIHSAMCVPLYNDKEIIGLIYCDRASLVGQFNEENLRLLTLLARLAAVKIENARLIEIAIEEERSKRERELAAQVQRRLLPQKDPDFQPYDISGSMRASRQVGGDYYDFIPVDEDRIALVIADVSGSGTPSALLMTSLRASLYSDIRFIKDLSPLTAKLNDSVHASTDTHSFISFFIGVLDRTNGDLSYVNAGHNPPLIVDGAGGFRTLGSTGFCLGMFPSVGFEKETTRLEPGEILCLFTDGIVESRNPAKEEYGEERLAARLRESASLPAREMISRIYDDVLSFEGGSEPGDDMSLVIVKKGGEGPQPENAS